MADRDVHRLLTGDVHLCPAAGGGGAPELVEACRGVRIACLAGGYGHLAVVPSGGGAPHSTSSLGVAALGALGALEALAFGKEHALALTAAGRVFSFGKGGWGQLGHASMSDAAAPLLVGALGGRAIVAVAAGGLHSLALAESGDVYAWGRGFEGQLGLGDGLCEAALAPRCVAGLAAAGCVCAIAAGAFHSAALGADGRVWTWGDGTCGQLGAGRLATKAPRPILVPGLPPCYALSCGHMHTAAAAGAGGAFCWGLGTGGQLGRRAAEPNRRFSCAPVKVGGELAEAHVGVIVCAGDSTAAINDASGRVLAWGDGVEAPAPLAGLAGAGRASRLASDGRATLVFVETALSHSAPACAPLVGGSELSLFGWGFYTAQQEQTQEAHEQTPMQQAPEERTQEAAVEQTQAAADEGERAGGILVRFEREGLTVDVRGSLDPPEAEPAARGSLRRLRVRVPPLGAEPGAFSVAASFDGGASFTPPLCGLGAYAQPRHIFANPPLAPLGGGAARGLLVRANGPLFRSDEAVARLTARPAIAPVPGGSEPAALLLPAAYDGASGGYFVDVRSVPSALSADLSLALDGASFGASVRVEIYAPPVLTRLEPACGPLAGGTRVAVRLAAHVPTEAAVVRLTLVPGAPLGRPPPAEAPAAEGAPASEGAPAGDEVALAAPSSASALAVTVTIPAYASRQQGGSSGGSSGEGCLIFTVPPNALGDAPAFFALELALNGVDFVPAERRAQSAAAGGAEQPRAGFCAHGELALSALVPSFGAPAGGTRVSAFGGRFFESGEAMARVHAGAVSKLVPAALSVAGDALEFQMPPWGADDSEASGTSEPIVEVSLNGADWTTWCRHFRYAPWHATSVEPPNGPPGAQLKLAGSGLGVGGPDARILVRFQATRPGSEERLEVTVDGSYSAADDAVLVEAPVFEGAPGVFSWVSLALNGVDFAPEEQQLEFKYDEPKGKGKK